MSGVFVTGTDTGVGKTVLSALLMAAAAPDVRYWKPVQTGADEDDDTRTVRALAELPPGRVLNAGARHQLPASPHHAAAAEGTGIRLEDLLAPWRARPPGSRWVVEGAGGLLVPLSPTLLMPELVAALGLPVVVAASTRLGAINHTLLTVHQALAAGLEVWGVVMMGPRDESALSGLAAHCPAPVVAEVPWLDPLVARQIRAAARRLRATPSLASRLAELL